MAIQQKSSASKPPLKEGNYAIVETSGQQFWLEPDRYYDFDRINAEIDQTITLDKILLINNQEGITLGNPYIKDAKVELKVLGHRRGPKIIVYKMRRKKKTRSKNGHRQEMTRVMVQSISIGNKTTKAKASTKTSQAKETTKNKASTKSVKDKETTKAKTTVKKESKTSK